MNKKITNNSLSSDQVINASPVYYLFQMIWKLFRFLLMVCMSFIILYPLFYMVSMAFRPIEEVYDPKIIWLPNSLTLENIKLTISTLDYFKVLGNTVFLSFTTTTIQLFMCSLIGYGFARFKIWGKNILLAVLVFTIIVPAQLISLPTYFNFKNLDFFGIIHLVTGSPSPISLLDNPMSFFILAFFGQGIRSGLFILIFKQFYSSMPMELESAAMVDGAGFVKTYYKIMLPNSLTVSLIIFLFSFVWYWNDYYLTTIYVGNFKTLSIILANIRPAFENSMGTLAFDPYYMVTIEQSGCLLTIIPILVLYIFTQKYFTESIERTGIVG